MPKIGYALSGFMKCTTFGAALESAMNFLGRQVDYEYIMFTSGAAFHQTWKDGWFPGNSSILTMCEDPFEPIHRGMNAVGHEYTIRMCSGVDNFGVKASARKSAYVTGAPVDEATATAEIVSSIDKGIPVLAIGVIDVPEWCIVAGYDDQGDTLLGWSYFQDNPQVRKDPNGYFMKSGWFKDTQGYVLVGGKKAIPPYASALHRHPEVRRENCAHTCGQRQSQRSTGVCGVGQPTLERQLRRIGHAGHMGEIYRIP